MQINGLIVCAALSAFLVPNVFAGDFDEPVYVVEGDDAIFDSDSSLPDTDEKALDKPIWESDETMVGLDTSMPEASDEFSESCWCCGRDPFWFAATEVLFLDVNADSGGRITLSFDNNLTPGVDIAFNSGTGFSDYAAAPRLTVGRQFGDRFAVAGRYFGLGGTDRGFPRLVPGLVPQQTFGSYDEINSVEMSTMDVEGIFSFYPGQTKIDATVGARHASLDVDSQINAFGVITPGSFANMELASGNAFDGTGVTTALMLRRQIGYRPVSLFLGGRGSKMWGHTDSFSRVAGTVASAGNPPLVGAATVSRNNATSDLVILEVQAGAQWEFELTQIPATAFFRLAVEYQNWDITGPPTGGAGFGGTIANFTTNSFASAGLLDTHFKGASVATGFTW